MAVEPRAASFVCAGLDGHYAGSRFECALDAGRSLCRALPLFAVGRFLLAGGMRGRVALAGIANRNFRDANQRYFENHRYCGNHYNYAAILYAASDYAARCRNSRDG